MVLKRLFKKSLSKKIMAVSLWSGLLAMALNPSFAADYPPALSYDTFLDGLEIDDQKATLPFASKVSRFEVFVPGRNVKGKLSIVDEKGQVLSSREYLYEYKNGKPLGEWQTDQLKCPGCVKGPGVLTLKPGTYWLVLSENNKVFSSEWFEVRSYALGKGRFAAGERYYLYAPASQMARLNTKDGDFRAEVGLEGGEKLGKESSLSVPFHAVLKQNGKEIARTPGEGNTISLYPQTTLYQVFFTRPNYNAIKAKDLTDGKYQIDVFVDGKVARRFDFMVKKGVIQTSGRQLENTPPERMIVSEDGTWIWNSFSKAPERSLPTIDWSSDPSTGFKLPF